jgi:hypothetical protein
LKIYENNFYEKIFNNTNKKRNWLILSSVFLIGLFVRIIDINPELPITQDAIEFFFYATDISVNNQLSQNYTPINNGWPIFMSFFFSMFNFDTTQSYMLLQKVLSISISSITVLPIFFLCKKYLGTFYGLIGSLIFAIEPKIIQNSLLGITEPLFIFLSISAFCLFLNSNKKIVILSFVVVTFASMIRGEGTLLLISMFILFIIKNRNKKAIPQSILIIFIVFLIMLPISMYRIDVTNSDGMFMRISDSSKGIISKEVVAGDKSYFQKSIENFPKFLGWSMIPIFLIFVPIGIISVIKLKKWKALTIIIPCFFVSLSAVHAYSLPALDTRYIFPLYPFLIIITLFGIKLILDKSKNPKIVFIIILGAMLISSAVYLNVKSIDSEHNFEVYLISKKITNDFKTMNEFYPESSYLEIADLPEKWPEFIGYFDEDGTKGVSIRQSVEHNFQLISIKNHKSLEDLIDKNSDVLNYIVVDDRENRPEFLKNIFENESKYYFLDKIYDSKDDKFDYHLKVFKINYEKFYSFLENEIKTGVN